MNIHELEIDLQRAKERSPETYNEIVKTTVPFYMFYRKLYSGVCRLEEDKYQLNPNELDVLSSLKMSGNEEFIMSPTRLNERLLFTSGALTKVLKKLEGKNYVKRIDSEFDKRSKLVQLTNLGREIHDKALKDVLAFEKQSFSALSQNEKNTFQKLLLKLLKD